MAVIVDSGAALELVPSTDGDDSGCKGLTSGFGRKACCTGVAVSCCRQVQAAHC